MMETAENRSPLEARSAFLTWVALLVALAAVVGTVYLSLGMKLKACPLCLYQRAFVFGVFGVLAVGLIARGMRRGLLSLLALPMALGGLVVSGFHVYLELRGTLECPAGIFEIGSAPQQAFAVLLLLLAVLVIDLLTAAPEGGIVPLLGGVVLGILFGVGSLLTAPPLPAPPTSPYTVPLNKDGCRPPFVSQVRAATAGRMPR
jgi:hypothetical protein